MNPRIRKAVPKEDYKLDLVFTNGERGLFDCSGLLNFGVFQELRDKNYFKQVEVLHGTVVWPHEQDICPDTLYLARLRQNGPLSPCGRVRVTGMFGAGPAPFNAFFGTFWLD